MQELAGTVRVKESGQAVNAVTGDVPPRRSRITADSFRRLTAKLKSRADPQAFEDLAEPASTVEPEVAGPQWEEASPAPPVLQETVSEWPVEPADQFQLPEFVPLNGLAIDPFPVAPAEPLEDLPVAHAESAEPAPAEAAESIDLPSFPEVEPIETAPAVEAEPGPVETAPMVDAEPELAAAVPDQVEAAHVEVEPQAYPDEEEVPSLPELAPFEAPIEFAAVAELEEGGHGSGSIETEQAAEPLAVEPHPAEVEPAASPAPHITIEPALIVEPQSEAGEAAELVEAAPAEAADGALHDSLPDESAVVIETPALARTVQPVMPAKPGRAPSALTEKVVEALIKTVTDAVYSKPSAAERAAFLREVAELVGRGEAEIPDALPLAPAKGESFPATADTVETNAEPAATVKDGIGGKLASGASLLRKQGDLDPFAAKAAFEPPKPVETTDADEEAGELAISLLDMMSGGAASSQPQERALAADTLLRLVQRIPIRQLLTIVERVAIMESPPPLLVARLIRDQRPEVAGPLLERCMHISDQDLANAVLESDMHKLRMMARRRIISPTLSDQLIECGDASVVLTLVRNPGATVNHDSFFRLADLAIKNPSILAPLTTRADLPAPVAFELFWHVPQELRRFIFSRFLTDSENLNRILKITLATQASGDGASEPKFPSREALEATMEALASGDSQACVDQLAELGNIGTETVARVISDTEGEPLAVLLKTLGYPRSKFTDLVERLQRSDTGAIRRERNPEELQSIFDTLSFNKARILVTYWDWFLKKAGPYAPHH